MGDFSFSNIKGGFDSHVRNHLPWYPLVSDMISFIVRNYLPTDGVVYDIGSSTGHIQGLCKEFVQSRNAAYITIDKEVNMCPMYVADACTFDYDNFDVAILNLTLMFIPIKFREQLLKKLYDKMNIGGCIIIVDKFNQPECYLSTVLNRATMYMKCKNLSSDEIIEKELSLSGIQIPMKHSELGYEPEQFFKFGEFEGYVITK